MPPVESFEDLGLDPALVEALAGEGIEHPTPLQFAGIPLVRRGNNLIAHGGAGAGTLVTYGVALLDRLEPGGGSPKALVLTPTTAVARRLAESLARLAQATGHVVASLGTPWAFPERADILFAAPADVLEAMGAGGLVLEEVQALVLDGASAIERAGGLQEVEAVLQYLPRDGQRVVVSLPLTPAVSDFIERHVKRGVHVPAQSAVDAAEGGPKRGDVHFRIVEEPKDDGALSLAAELLAEDARHVAFFFRNEDRAADVGDFLTLHGYESGAPGETDVPVWLVVDELGALPILEAHDGVEVVSYDVPAGPDSLDRRHGGGRGGTVLLVARELAHLRDVARRTGYKVIPAPPPEPRSLPGDLGDTVAALRHAVDDEDLAPYLLLIEPLLSEFDAAELAAAALALLRKKVSVSLPAPAVAAAPGPPPPPAWVRLYVSVGERDQITPRDLVGAITGEAGIEGSRVGKIEMRESFSLVEVQEAVAQQVIRALNGTTIRGRATRVDFDRGRRAPAGAGPSRGPGRRG